MSLPPAVRVISYLAAVNLEITVSEQKSFADTKLSAVLSRLKTYLASAELQIACSCEVRASVIVQDFYSFPRKKTFQKMTAWSVWF